MKFFFLSKQQSGKFISRQIYLYYFPDERENNPRFKAILFSFENVFVNSKPIHMTLTTPLGFYVCVQEKVKYL